jgi:hypothetical protein
MINHVLVRLETHAKSGWVFGETSAERVLVLFAVVRELPEFQRPQR